MGLVAAVVMISSGSHTALHPPQKLDLQTSPKPHFAVVHGSILTAGHSHTPVTGSIHSVVGTHLNDCSTQPFHLSMHNRCWYTLNHSHCIVCKLYPRHSLDQRRPLCMHQHIETFKGGYTSENQFATFYLVDEDYDVQDVNMSNVHMLGTSSGGEVACEYYEQSFVVSSEVYNEYTSNPGRNLRVLMVQSASVFDGGKCAGGSGPPLFQPNFGQVASVNITDRLCKTPEGNGIIFQNNDIGHMGIEVVAEPTSEAAFVKGSMSLVIMLLVLVSW